ncbi:conserved exported hypothetical protein [Methylocella tundrae]|uniref:Uncharacterized protein n=1 Tax=Methylocella tundrae TaxID=227605 RepID=A0A8B6MBE0_METTU|nr:hypothetical protein [Methylocella tundrae]VTZ52310.1 conserved exported hypothetical protein [Methylocella tundrae]
MDKKIIGLVGAMSALGALAQAANATPLSATEVLKVDSFGDLLEPIPNAIALLRVVDAAQATASDEQSASKPAEAQLAQYYNHHHHHHHHHRAWRHAIPPVGPGYRHHHHHHHHYYRQEY